MDKSCSSVCSLEMPESELLDINMQHPVVKEEDPYTARSNIQLKSAIQDVKYEIPSDGDDIYLKLEPVSEELHLKNEDDVSVEELKHAGEKPFECNGCGKTFRQKCNLRLHMKTHTGENLAQCNICDKKFIAKSHLRRHMITHTGEKLFQCNVCDTKFTQKSSLQKHAKTHTGVKPFQCKLCANNKNFLRRPRHMNTHTGEKPFQCNVCDKQFTQKGNLRQHMKTHT